MTTRDRDTLVPETAPPALRGDVLLGAVSRATRTLLSAASTAEGIEAMLAIIGETAGFTRVYVFQNRVEPDTGELLADCPYLWGDDDVRDRPGAFPVRYSSYPPHILANGLAGKPVRFGSREIPKRQDQLIKSGSSIAHQLTWTVGVPIKVRSDLWGWLSFDHVSASDPFSDADIATLETAAVAVGALLERDAAEQVRLAAERERVALLDAINRAALALLSSPDLDAAIHLALAELAVALRIGRAVVGVLSEPDAQSTRGYITWRWEWTAAGVVRVSDDPQMRSVNLDQQPDIYEKAIANEIVLIHDNAARDGVEADQAYQDTAGARAGFCVPIFDGNRCWGSISGDDVVSPRVWSEAEIVAVRLMAAAIGGAVGKAREQAARIAAERARAELAEAAAADLRRRSDLLEAVVAASDAFLKAQSLNEAADAVVERLGRAMRVDRSVIAQMLPPSGPSRTGWFKLIHEWASPGLQRQIDDPTLNTLNNDAYEEFLAPMRRGEAVAIVVSDIVDPVARAEQEATGSLSQYQQPIMVDGVLWGSIGADDCTRPRRFDDAEIATLQLVASALGSLIKREQLTEARLAAEKERAEVAERAAADLRRRSNLLEAVVAASDAFLKARSLDEAADTVVERIGRAMGVDRSAIGRILPASDGAAEGWYRMDHEWTAPGISRQMDQPALRQFDLSSYVDFIAPLREGQAVSIVVDDFSDPIARAEQEATGSLSQYMYPILVDGVLWGSIGADDCTRPRRFDDAEIATLQLVASALGSLIKREQLTEARLAAEKERAEVAERAAADLRRRSDLLEAVVAASDALLKARSLDEAADAVVERIGRAMDLDRVVLGRCLPPSNGSVEGWLEMFVEWTSPGTPRQTDNPALRLFDMTSYPEITGPLKAGRPIAIVTEDIADSDARAEQEATGALSQYQYPIMVDGALWGGIGGDDCTRPRRFDAAEVATLQLVASALGSLIKREQLTEARLQAERDRIQSLDRVNRLLRSIVAGTRSLLDAPDFEVALNEWLAMMCAVQGAASAAFYDVVVHPDAGLRTVRVLAEWAPPDTPGRRAISFAKPFVHDPRGAEHIDAAMARGETVAIHTTDLDGHARLDQLAQGHATTITVPIMDSTGYVGAVSFDYMERRELNPEDDAILKTAADALAAVLRRNETQAALVTAQEERTRIAEATAADLRRRSELLEAVVAASDDFLKAQHLDEAAYQVVERLGQTMTLGRMTLNRCLPPSEGSVDGWLETMVAWVAPSAPAHVHQRALTRFDRTLFANVMAPLAAGKCIAIQTEEITDPAARAEQEATGNLPQYHYPIRVDGVLWGTIAGDDYTRPRKFDAAETAALRLVASALGNLTKRELLTEARLASEQERAELAEAAAADLRRRSNLLEAVVAASDAFLKAQSLDEAADAVVERIGRAMGVDRSVVGRFLPPSGESSEGWFELLYEWTSPGVPRQIENPALRVVNMSHYMDFFGPLRAGHAVAIVTEDIVDPVARAEQEAAGAQSQYVYPIMVDGVLWGVIGSDDCTRPRRFDDAEIATLQLVASALGSLIKREQLTAARLAAERELAEEKSRMAREIHDTLAQGFTGVIMQLHATQDAMEARDDTDAGRHVGRALERARFGLAEARRSVYALRPPLLDDGDLAGALQMVARRVFDGVGIRADVETQGDPEALPEAIMVELFRIGQEAMGNALRHAGAKRVAIQLDFRDKEACTLSVSDDGRGFDVEAAQIGTGFGLVSMRERAERLGAVLTIRSAPGSGTTVAVIAPRQVAPASVLAGGLPRDL